MNSFRNRRGPANDLSKAPVRTLFPSKPSSLKNVAEEDSKEEAALQKIMVDYNAHSYLSVIQKSEHKFRMDHLVKHMEAMRQDSRNLDYEK